MRRRPPTVLLAPLAVAALALGAAACGDDDGDGDDAQPVPGAADFGDGGFDELPRFPGAQAVGDPTVEGDATSQSWSVATATPQRVFDQLAADLEDGGWIADDPGRSGADRSYRGVWQRGEQEVVLSATRFDSGEDDEATTQYSMSLSPA